MADDGVKTGRPIRIIGFDPGLRNTGWGVIEVTANRLVYIADGVVSPDNDRPLAWRLRELHEGLGEVMALHQPDEAAVEETFVNVNPVSTLKLGAARGVVMLAPAVAGVPVAEYPANVIKKSLVGNGHAGKNQIQTMVSHLLPGWCFSNPDAADALATAICHSHMAGNRRAVPEPRQASRQDS